MRTTAIALLLVTLLLSAAHCATQGKITLDAQNMPLKDAIAQMAQQSQASIVLDPKAEGTVTVNLTDVDVSQALDLVTKLNKLTWKKVSFALPEGDTAKLEQIKSAVLALASIPVTGMMVDDPATKQSAVMAKNLPSSPETAAVKLPEGYSWKTFYVVTPPIVAPAPTTAGSKDKLAELTAAQAKTIQDLASLTPEQRQQYYANEIAAQMALTPEARQSLMRDRMEAMHNVGPQYRDQMREDMHAAFGGMHPDGGPGGHGGHHGGNGQQAQQ
jgi:hypothetical protein